MARCSQTTAGDARPASGEGAAPQGWWPGMLEVAEEPSHGLGGPCPCVCFTQVACKTREPLVVHTVVSRGSRSLKGTWVPGGMAGRWAGGTRASCPVRRQTSEPAGQSPGAEWQPGAQSCGRSLVRACSPGSAWWSLQPHSGVVTWRMPRRQLLKIPLWAFYLAPDSGKLVKKKFKDSWRPDDS